MKTNLTSADPSGWYEFACESLGRQVAHWDGQYLRGGGCTFYQPNCRNFRRLYSESDVAALREELTALRDEVKRFKSQPYEMRRADRPDCVGIWCDKEAEILTIEELSELSFPFLHPPYFYLGPIPVIVEQQPKVVKVRCKETGEVCRAIQATSGTYMILEIDGRICDETDRTSWEEVQS